MDYEDAVIYYYNILSERLAEYGICADYRNIILVDEEKEALAMLEYSLKLKDTTL